MGRAHVVVFALLSGACGSIEYGSSAELPRAERHVLATAGSSVSVTIQLFYQELAPYGEWRDHARHGRVFVPHDTDYRPYRNGHWVETDEGVEWVSYDAIGWAVTHYGAWIVLDDGRWAWVPDTEWAPAWVEWRYSDEREVVGWAPRLVEGTPPVTAWIFIDTTLLLADFVSSYAYPYETVSMFYADCVPFAAAPTSYGGPPRAWMGRRGVRGFGHPTRVRARGPGRHRVRARPPRGPRVGARAPGQPARPGAGVATVRPRRPRARVIARRPGEPPRPGAGQATVRPHGTVRVHRDGLREGDTHVRLPPRTAIRPSQGPRLERPSAVPPSAVPPSAVPPSAQLPRRVQGPTPIPSPTVTAPPSVDRPVPRARIPERAPRRVERPAPTIVAPRRFERPPRMATPPRVTQPSPPPRIAIPQARLQPRPQPRPQPRVQAPARPRVQAPSRPSVQRSSPPRVQPQRRGSSGPSLRRAPSFRSPGVRIRRP